MAHRPVSRHVPGHKLAGRHPVFHEVNHGLLGLKQLMDFLKVLGGDHCFLRVGQAGIFVFDVGPGVADQLEQVFQGTVTDFDLHELPLQVWERQCLLRVSTPT
jgi:hypothetical protein